MYRKWLILTFLPNDSQFANKTRYRRLKIVSLQFLGGHAIANT